MYKVLSGVMWESTAKKRDTIVFSLKVDKEEEEDVFWIYIKFYNHCLFFYFSFG